MKTTNLAKAAAPIFAALLANTGTRYVSVADTAKLVRAALKDAFPGTKFSVRSDSYSGGASVRVRWVDGPTTEAVNEIVKGYEGADFDGTIDLKSHSTAWLSPDGKVSIAHAQGTTGSRGCHPELIGDPHDPSAIEVHFMADYVPVTREFSREARLAALETVRATYAGVAELSPRPEYVIKTSGDHSWLDLSSDPYVERQGAYLSTLIGRHLHGRTGGAEVAV